MQCGVYVSFSFKTRRVLPFLAAATAGIVIAYQGCSKANFSQGNGGSNGAAGGESTPLTPGGNDARGAIFQYGDETGVHEVIVQPPTLFTQTNCSLGYPVVSGNPATNVDFNESDVLVAYSPQNSTSAAPGLTVSAFYDDEHAMTLGVRRVIVKSAAGTATTDYPVSPLPASPSQFFNPSIGATALTGDQAGTDTSSCPGVPYVCARPLYPALFVTDITANPANRAGDWQSGGKAIAPHAVFGTWKAAVRTVDKTANPAKVTVTPDADPQPNGTNLNGIAFPAGAQDEGFSSVVSWQVSRLGLQSGHTYRMQFMVHDGDQNKTGGDAGENCVNISIP
jgi:hypothetical protein